LNVDAVHPLASIRRFTFDFPEEASHATDEFVTKLAAILDQLRSARITPVGVTSDACSFQKKGLRWGDPDSLQAIHPDFQTLIFVLCICHRMQNALQH
jgi:hypothetical protein